MKKFIRPTEDEIYLIVRESVEMEEMLKWQDETYMLFVGFEPHTFDYPGRCPIPVRLEKTTLTFRLRSSLLCP